MGLAIGRQSVVKFRVISTLIATFALVVQPMYGLVSAQVANAASSDANASISAATSCVAGKVKITVTATNHSGQNASGTYKALPYVNGDPISAAAHTTVTKEIDTNLVSVSPGGEVTVDVTSPTTLHYDTTYSALNCASITVGAGGNFATLQEGIDNVAIGGTITFISNLTTSAKVNITKPVTINGDNKTLTAASGVTGAVIEEQNIAGVTVSNLVIDGGGNSLHPFKTFKGTVDLNDVTLRNSGKQGLLVNSATVTVSNLTTSGNAWGGVNVDQSSSSGNPAVLTVNGTSHHTETLADIYIDDTTEEVTVNDTSNQYDILNPGVKPNDQAYKLKTSSPVRNITTDKGFTTIQAAIDDSATADGNIIEVSDGTFDEFTVTAGADSNLTIRAASGAHPVIEATTPSSSRVVDLRGVGTIVEGFTIRSFQAGNGNVVYLDGDESVIRNNVIEGSTSDGSNGIFTSKDSNPVGNNVITGNTIVSPRGINLRNTGNTVTNNKVTSTVKSLSVEREGNTIEFNNFYSGAVRAVQSYNEIDLNVEKNWWGQDTGVDPAAVVRDSAGGSIDSDPWLCEEYVGQASPRESVAGSCAPVDNVAPAVSNITAEPIVNGNIGKTTTVTFDLNDATGINLSKTKVLFSDGPNDVNRAKESSKFNPVLVSGNTYRVTINTQDFVKKNYSGNYNLKFELWDTLGNHKSAKPSTFRGILIDNTGPSISDVRVNNPVKGEAEIRVKMSDPSDVNLASGTYVRFSHGTALSNADASSANTKFTYDSASGDYVANIDTTTFADNGSGTYWLYIRAQDQLGNASANDDTRGIVVDNQAPAKVTGMRILSGGNNLQCDGFTKLRSITVYWDNSMAADFDHFDYQNKDGGTIQQPTISQFGPANIRDEDGYYKYRVAAVDTVGNIGEFSDWCGVTLDRVAPTVTITTPTGVLGGNVQINGSVTDNQKLKNYYLTVFDLSNNSIVFTKNVNRTSDISGQLATWDTSGKNGNYRIVIEARDAADNKDGNRNNLPTSNGSSVDYVDVVVDNTEPTVAITSPSNGQVLSTQTSNGKLTITGTARDDSNFNYYYCYVTITGHGEVGVRDAKCQTAWAAGTPSKTAFADTVQGTTNGTLGTVDLTGVVDGNYTVHVVAKDKAGNTTTATQDFVLDNAAPSQLTVTNPQAGDTITDRTPTFTGVTDPNTAVTVKVGGQTLSTTSDGSGNYSVTAATLANGSYTAAVTSTDGAGNATTVSRQFTIGSVGGPTVITSPTAPAAFGAIPAQNQAGATGIAANGQPANSDTAILGAQTEADATTTGDTLGTSTTAALAPSESGWKIFGLAWYWWLLIAAAVAGLWWLIAGALRRRRETPTV